jgi:L-lactate dehydrogenase (cytochrome)
LIITAVGIGRPFLYAFSSYGQDGVEKALQILRVRHLCRPDLSRALTYYFGEQDEFEMNMRLIGAPTIKDIRRDMVDASSLSSHIGTIPSDKLYDSNCK